MLHAQMDELGDMMSFKETVAIEARKMLEVKMKARAVIQVTLGRQANGTSQRWHGASMLMYAQNLQC